MEKSKTQNHYDFTDIAFEKQFKSCELSPSIFSHEAHLRLAWIHICKYGIKQALKNIETDLKKFVVYHGAETKYHQTITIVAINAVHYFMQQSNSNSFKTFICEYPELINNFKALVNSHYTFNIFTSEEARKEFIEPDLSPFSH